MGGGRLFGLLVLLVALVAVSPGRAAAAIYDPARDCVDETAVGEYDRVDRRGGYEVYGRGPGVRAAEDAAQILRREGFFAELESRFGDPRVLVGADGRPLAYQVFVTRESLGGDLGRVTEYCGSASADAALVDADQDRRELAATLAHELFHSFSAGAGGAQIGGWWAEATATWGEMQLARDERTVEPLDRQFNQRPDLPIDRRVGDDEFRYGAWRFVEWIGPYLGGDDALYAFMAATFRRMGGGAEDVRAVRDELAARGLDLGEELGRFWGERLYPANPLSGRATQGTRVEFPSEEPGAGELSQDLALPAEQLAAAVARLRLARDSNVQRITFSAERAPPGTHLWVQNGRDLEDWSAGDEATFCVGGSSPSIGAKAWGGQLPLAFTNGNSTPPGPVITHALTVTVSAEECPGLVDDPAAAIDDSPVLELPRRCPGPPEYFSPPPRTDDPADGFHTDYFVFRERIDDVYLSFAAWQRAVVARVQERDLSARSAGRLLARWLFCASNRVRDLDHLPGADGRPDGLIQRWRGQMATKLRRAAQQYERGNFGATATVQDASLRYVQIVTRCTTQDIATAT